MNGYVRETEIPDLRYLADHLREADIAEIKALSGRDPYEALKDGFDATHVGGRCRTICLPNGIPAGIFGVVPVRPQVGGVWMVATDKIHSIRRQFLKECRSEIASLSRGFKLTFNYTDARNTVHHRWIRWAGFTIIKRHEALGVEGRPFLEFVRITEDHYV